MQWIHSFKDKCLADWPEQRQSLILWIPVCIGLGIGWYFSLHHEPEAVWLYGGFFLCLLMTAIHLFLKRWGESHLLPFIGSVTFEVSFLLWAALFWTLCGFTAAHYKTHSIDSPVLQQSIKKPVSILGKVTNREIKEAGKGYVLMVEPVAIQQNYADWPQDKIPDKIRIVVRLKSIQLSDIPALGDTISLLAKIEPPSRPVMPGAMDFQRFYYFQRVGAMGFALSTPDIIQHDSESLFLERMRENIGAAIHKQLNSRIGGIATALMTGERAAIEAADWDALRASGLAHIISISGLHVVMVATPVFFIIRLFLAAMPFIALRYPIKKIAALFALIACCFYIGIIVPSVPSTRAMMMTGIMLIAVMLDRSPFSMRLVCFSAACILIYMPEAILSASFQMSFAAVTLLIAFADWIKPWWRQWSLHSTIVKKSALYLFGTILTTIIASIATSPFSSFHFQQISMYGVLANGLAIPLTGFVIMPMVVFSFIMMPFKLMEFPLHIMGKGIEWMIDIAHVVADMPGAVITTAYWPLSALILLVFSALFLVLCSGIYRSLMVIPMAGFVVILCFFQTPIVLVSESGKQILIQERNNTTGSSVYVANKRAERSTLAEWLQRLNVSKDNIDVFVREGINGPATCDSAACRININGLHISYGTNQYSLQQDCAWADILITPNVINFSNNRQKCNAKIIDKFSLMKSGAVAIDAHGHVQNVTQQQGDRPWAY